MHKPHYIVAIGASAGGIEEIIAFFDHTPSDGVSYVVVQHLQPDVKSRMTEVLAKHSLLLVEEAQEGTFVKPNQVYLIPSDKLMTISNNTLQLTDRDQYALPHYTIDTFFKSLAADIGPKAIAVVLSGLGNDGTEGVKAIKTAGGLLIARDPETTVYSSMPQHAIATGVVDFVLEPELMPSAIEDFVKYGTMLLADHKDDGAHLAEIIELINEHSPLDFTEYKKSTILRRTKRRAAFRDFNTLEQYLVYLKSNLDEIKALTKEYLISVTSFFRDKQAFQVIQQEILPKILARLVPGEELKMWIAGCATGEEVYSMAILIAEQLVGRYAGTTVKLFATDIDSAALTFAGKGIYPKTITADVPASRLERFFVEEGEQYRISPAIRKMVIFAHHDLVKNPPYCNMHFIACRNLLIYMTPVLQRKVFNILLFGLKLEGYLFLGISENPAPISKNLEVIHKQWKLYKNMATNKGTGFDTFTLPDLAETRQTSFSTTMAKTATYANSMLAETLQVSLANELQYLAVCIDDQHQVIKSYGDTTRYLLNKHFSTNLTDLLPKPLAVAFNMLNRQVLATDEKQQMTGINIRLNEVVSTLNLSIVPLAEKTGTQKLFMVIFTADTTNAEQQDQVVFNEQIYHDRYTLNLEEEVQELKEKLHMAYQKLDATNENLQSFNEELLSANEEMQSTNEEMQSVNEELQTINGDYQLKNKELVAINDDLNNYFRSNVHGQLFINSNLQLMKFSPGTVKQINLQESDIGRPLSNISTNFKFETIIDDIKQVLIDGLPITREIQTNNGQWYQVMTMPYIQQADQQTTGAIITFNDITDLKKIQHDFDRSNQMLGMAIDSAEMGTWIIDTQTLAFTCSARLKAIFGYEAADELTYEAALAQIDLQDQAMVSTAVTAAMREGKKFEIEYRLRGHDDGKLRWVRAIGNLTAARKGKPVYFTGVLVDITVYKQDELRKNDFIAMASHELKTPLTSLQGYVQLLTGKAKVKNDQLTVTMLDKVQRQVNKMSALINGFLNISQMETGKITLNRSLFDISQVISDLVDDFVNSTGFHQLTFHPCPELYINGDSDKIGQVIGNMISNAMKYSPKGKQITVACEKIDDWVQVSVKDEGMGIDAEDQHKLFNRYQRIESVNTHGISGFGLGLYLSAEIIYRHQGKIWVNSEMAKGSTFYFSLPMV